MKTFVIGDIHGRCAQLHNLLGMLPRDESADKLIFLGDLIDRGPDVPGCVEHVLNLCTGNPEQVLCLRGNHEQMLLDFLDDESTIWMTTATGGDQTFRQYTETPLRLRADADFAAARENIAEQIRVDRDAEDDERADERGEPSGECGRKIHARQPPRISR